MKRLFLLLVIGGWMPLTQWTTTAQPSSILQITDTNGSATISWPTSNLAGVTVILQATTNLSSSNFWVDLTVPTSVVGGRTTAILPMANVQQFFRLKIPIFSFGFGVPVFQYAIFYNMDAEICPGADMTINGETLVDGNVWADPDAGATLTFAGGLETTASSVFYTRNPNDPQPGTPSPHVVYVNPPYPLLNIAPEYGMTGYFPTGGSSMFAISNSTNLVRAMLDPPPGGEDPNSAAGQERFYNFADLIITNSSSGVITAFFQDSNNVTRLTPLPCDLQAIAPSFETNFSTEYQTNVIFINHPPPGHYVTNIATVTITNVNETDVTNYVYSFVTNTTFYDYREGKTVQAVQIDMGNLVAWITNDTAMGGSLYNAQNVNDKGHGIDSVYVYSGVPLTNTQLPAVRLVNGQQLQSDGLTIATPMPLYVLGNYNVQTPAGTSVGTNNTTYTYPAAFMADAVTVLSSNWNDSDDGNTDLTQRAAADTTVNAAIFQGIVPSVTVGGVKHYSGGVENFLRLLEDWSANTLTYNGSYVAMFNCQYATNYWKPPSNYYNAPTWQWGFDTNFLNQNLLPPGTPYIMP